MGDLLPCIKRSFMITVQMATLPYKRHSYDSHRARPPGNTVAEHTILFHFNFCLRRKSVTIISELKNVLV
jgi:hypothetical protein